MKEFVLEVALRCGEMGVTPQAFRIRRYAPLRPGNGWRP
jgi:hypothetical protein